MSESESVQSSRYPRGSLDSWALALFVATRSIAAWTESTINTSDEAAYFESGSRLAHGLAPDPFWPPLTPWLDALVVRVTRTESFLTARVLWHLLDLAVFFLLPRLVRELRTPADRPRSWTLGEAMQLAYAVYLPAIGFSSVATSEMPALLLACLLNLIVLARPLPTSRDSAAAGLLAGFLILTRTSLFPWLVALPLFLLSQPGAKHRVRKNAFVAAISCAAVVLAVVLSNGLARGTYVVSTNGYHDFYLGNTAVYQEDLNLFRTTATPEQIAYRRAYFAGDVPAEDTFADTEHFAEALRFVAGDPVLFGRRALGRLARVFAPKTEQLDLLGGISSVTSLSPQAVVLLAATNVEWGAALFAGVAGLAYLAVANRTYFRLVWLNLGGSLPLCVVAISKPRYSFPFEVFLMMAAIALVRDLPWSLRQVWARHRAPVAVAYFVLVWAWAAWLVFAFTSQA